MIILLGGEIFGFYDKIAIFVKTTANHRGGGLIVIEPNIWERVLQRGLSVVLYRL